MLDFHRHLVLEELGVFHVFLVVNEVVRQASCGKIEDRAKDGDNEGERGELADPVGSRKRTGSRVRGWGEEESVFRVDMLCGNAEKVRERGDCLNDAQGGLLGSGIA